MNQSSFFDTTIFGLLVNVNFDYMTTLVYSQSV